MNFEDLTPDTLTLGELIEELEKLDEKLVFPVGLKEPHRYRGAYYDLAFELAPDVSVGQMLALVKEAEGATYQYKGGDFHMNQHTLLHIANYGDSGETLGRVLWAFMVDAAFDR